MRPGCALALLLLCGSASAAAQTVYRCGADGRSYSDAPCRDGRPVQVDDARTPAQRGQSAAAMRGDARAAAAMERERERREPVMHAPASLGLGPAAARTRVADAPPAVDAKPRASKRKTPDKNRVARSRATPPGQTGIKPAR